MKLSTNQAKALESYIMEIYPTISYFIRLYCPENYPSWLANWRAIHQFQNTVDGFNSKFEYNLFVILFILESEGELL